MSSIPNVLEAPPRNSQMDLEVGKDKTHVANPIWQRWFNRVFQSTNAPVAMTAPTAHNSQGVPGQIATDGNFLYVCIATNLWKRVAISTW